MGELDGQMYIVHVLLLFSHCATLTKSLVSKLSKIV